MGARHGMGYPARVMRVVWSFSLVLLACGGRTLGDPIFDDVPEGGGLASGGRAAGGARNSGGHLTGGATSSGGVAPATGGTGGGLGISGGFTFGGQVGSGGTLAAGGRFATGGSPFSGGRFSTGGFSNTGGTAKSTGGTGGAPFIDKSCVQFCDKVQGLCGFLPDTLTCAAGCSQPLASSSPACQAATRSLLDCVNMALSTPLASCEAIGTLGLVYCSDQLLKANACNTVPPEMCTDSIIGTDAGCQRVRQCGTTEYRTTCQSGTGFAACRCQINGKLTTKMGFTGDFDTCKLAASYACP